MIKRDFNKYAKEMQVDDDPAIREKKQLVEEQRIIHDAQFKKQRDIFTENMRMVRNEKRKTHTMIITGMFTVAYVYCTYCSDMHTNLVGEGQIFADLGRG